jgi:hypothetical protein
MTIGELLHGVYFDLDGEKFTDQPSDSDGT